MRHLDQALQLLAPGGRLVAIMGRGQMPFGNASLNEWWDKFTSKYNVRLAIALPGDEYGKFGTSFDNSMMVIDKTGPTPGSTFAERARNIKIVEAANYAEALTAAVEIGAQRPALEQSAPSDQQPSSGGRRPSGGTGKQGVPGEPGHGDTEPRPTDGERQPGEESRNAGTDGRKWAAEKWAAGERGPGGERTPERLASGQTDQPTVVTPQAPSGGSR
jgi:hypothetical protein